MGWPYDHGEDYYYKSDQRGCTFCRCDNGTNRCIRNAKIICPVLDCPDSEQILEDGDCCHRCKVRGSCGSIPSCHINASCYDTSFGQTCKCDHGFIGNGTFCQGNTCVPVKHRSMSLKLEIDFVHGIPQTARGSLLDCWGNVDIFKGVNHPRSRVFASDPIVSITL